jgi:hypothetical protein
LHKKDTKNGEKQERFVENNNGLSYNLGNLKNWQAKSADREKKRKDGRTNET